MISSHSSGQLAVVLPAALGNQPGSVCGFCAASFTGAANLPRTAPTMGCRLVPERAIAGFSSVTISCSGPVAQSVEQRIENPCVGGSIPPQATTTQRLTVLGWAFSFSEAPLHAGERAVLRVPRRARQGAE